MRVEGVRDETQAGDDFPDDFADESAWVSDDDFADENPYTAPPVRRSRTKRDGSRGSMSGLEQVGLGLLIQGWSITTMLLTLAGLIMFAVVSSDAGLSVGVLRVIGGAGGLALIAAGFGVLIGEFMCLATPERSGARGLIQVAVSCLVVQLMINITVRILPLITIRPSVGIFLVLAIINAAAAITHLITYLLFQKTIAESIRRDDLARQARTILVGFGVCAGGLIFVVVMGRLTGGGAFAAILGLLIGLPSAIAVLVFAVMQLFLLFRLGAALRS